MKITGNEKAWIAFLGALFTFLATELPVTGSWHEAIAAVGSIITGIITYFTRNTGYVKDIPQPGEPPKEV